MRADENELLTKVGPDTPMGKLIREYWIPLALSSELVAGGAPVRLRVLGENFLGFRSPDGRIGVIDHRCGHRCASLYYGRNEEGGMRCVYHGWKFDTDGQCVDMPSEPPETDYKERVSIAAARTSERYGVVWAYFGTRDIPPPLPHFDLDQVPESEISTMFLFRECNWLQAMEGDIDTCHVGFLHLGAVGPERFEEGSINYYRQLPENLAPKYEAIETAYGNIYCASRPAGENMYHRIGQYGLPFWTMSPSDPLGYVRIRAWVPIDDDHAMLVVIAGKRPRGMTYDKDGNVLEGTVAPFRYLPNSSDWYGRFRIEQNRENDHLIDRAVQRHGSYTGIQGIPVQDQAVTESMGQVVDRTKEHLGTSDRMIMLTRRKLMRAATAFAERGVLPAGIDDPEVYRYVRAGFLLLPKDQDWLGEFNLHRAEWSSSEAAPIERLSRGSAPAPVGVPAGA